MTKTTAEKEAAKAAKLAEKEAARAARGSAEGEESEPAETETDETEADADELDVEESDDDADSAVVEYHNPQVGTTTRKFTREIHGAKFKALAAMFAEKTGGKVLK